MMIRCIYEFVKINAKRLLISCEKKKKKLKSLIRITYKYNPRYVIIRQLSNKKH